MKLPKLSIKPLLSLALCCGLMGAQPALSQSMELKAVPESIQQSITAGLRKAIPEFEIEYISRTPADGLYSVQVLMGPKIFVNGAGDFLINDQGHSITVENDEFVAWLDPVEQQRELKIKGIAKQELNKMPKEEMIVYSPKGKPKAHVFVFTDVDCGYCVKLHQEVPKMNEMGIEVRYLAFPRAGMMSASGDKLARAFCAKDSTDALTELKAGGGMDRSVCPDHPMAEHLKLVRELGLRGTPGIFLADGTKIPGYRSAEELAALVGI